MARRIRRSFGKRGPKNNVWSVVLLDGVLIPAGTALEPTIVSPSEWQPAASGFEHATLLRIRGWLSIARRLDQVAESSIFMMIYKNAVDDGVSDPSDVGEYPVEDVLWTGGARFPLLSGATSDVSVNPVQFDVDVKAMRRIDSAEEIRLSLISSIANTVRISGVLRALIRKS